MADRTNFLLTSIVYLLVTNVVCAVCASFSCDVCTCYHDTLTVDCTDGGLRSLPTNVSLAQNATSLLLNGNDVNITDALQNFPALLTLDLSDNDLTHASLINVESITLKNLSMAHNKITQLTSDMFSGFENLTSLDLSFNFLSAITKDTFNSIPKLINLKLQSNNALITLADGAFNGLSSLQTLNLANNSLRHIPTSSFNAIPTLQVLNLQGNQIELVPAFSFAPLVALRTLSLAENQLTALDDRSFCGINCSAMAFLSVLDLHQNDITEFPSDSLLTIPNLVDLNVDRTVIAELKERAVSNLKDLKKFSISNSQTLRYIHHSAFHNLTNLQEIRIRYNHELRHIDEDAFWNVPKLSRVYLDHNIKLASLPKTLLNWRQLSILVLEDSNLTCDCDLQWIMDLWRTNISKEFLNSLVCSGPDPWTGSLVRKMSVHAFHCSSIHRVHLTSTENKILSAFIISTVTFVVLVTCILSVKFRTKIRACIRRQFRYKHQKDDAIFVVEPQEEDRKDATDIEQPTEGTPMTTISLLEDDDLL